jgi:trimethylamine--corrinoid protein Co-methyltransferase
MRSQTRNTIVRPQVTVLTPDQIDEVHSHSLALLSSVGVRVDSERARGLFRRALGTGAVVDDRVRIPGELVDWALQVASPSVEFYSRTGSPAFRLPGPARFGIGVTTLYCEDPTSGEIVRFGRKHMQDMVRLGGALPSFDVVSTVGIVQDVPPEVSDLVAVLEMVANTTKPLVLLVSDEGAFPAVLEMLEELHGDLSTRPFVIPYFNPISPLVINQGTADKMLAAVEHGLPFIYSNYGMAGASTPILPGGTLVLLNAELLAGLVLGQLMKPGTPMILGSLPAYFDMRGKGSFYTSHSYTIDLACAEMMAHYHLPHCGTSGSGMGWGADLIAAGHQWMNHLLSCTGRVGLVPFVGDNLGAIVFSPATVVYANDIIAQARSLAEGFPLDDTTIALDEIAEVGPGGNFLLSPQTLKNFRTAYFRSPILPPMTLEDWQARGCREAGEVLREHTSRLAASLEPPEDHAAILERGEAFIAAHPRR